MTEEMLFFSLGFLVFLLKNAMLVSSILFA